MGGKRAAEGGDDNLREQPAIVRAVDRQAGDELLRARGRETERLQLLGAARRLHGRQELRSVTSRRRLLQVEPFADDGGQLAAIPGVRDGFTAEKLLYTLWRNARPVEERDRRLSIALRLAAPAGGKTA